MTRKKEKYSSLGEKRMDIRTNLEIGYPGLADTRNSRVEREGRVRDAPGLQA